MSAAPTSHQVVRKRASHRSPTPPRSAAVAAILRDLEVIAGAPRPDLVRLIRRLTHLCAGEVLSPALSSGEFSSATSWVAAAVNVSHRTAQQVRRGRQRHPPPDA